MVHLGKPWHMLFIVMAVCVAGCSARHEPGNGSGQSEGPVASGPSDPQPSAVLANWRPQLPPPLATAEDVPAFVSWASRSTARDKEIGRKAIEAARNNGAVVEGLVAEIERSRPRDHSRTLVALAILGEMRNPRGEEFLKEFVNLPLPERGTLVDGEIVEQTALATLQAKAADGLAYMNSARSNAEVLRIAGAHPSRIVRAEAINAYLFNHGDSAAARRALTRAVRPDEIIFIDRVRRNPGEKKETFNRKVTAFLKAHPEMSPPAPEHNPGEQRPRDEHSAPPSF